MNRGIFKLTKNVQQYVRNTALLAPSQCKNHDKRWISLKSHSNNRQKLTESFDHCASTIPLIGKTLGSLLDDTTELCPENEAIICYNDNRRLTFAEFQSQVDQLASSLLALGLERGDRVGVWGQNHLEWLLSFYAIARAGLIVVNINPAYKSSELEYALNKVKVKAMLMMPTFKDTDYYGILHEVAPEIEHCAPGMLNAESVPSLKHVVMTEGPAKVGTFSYSELFKQGGYTEQQEVNNLKKSIQFDDPVNIQFTSGTTGNPKGATLTHHNIVNNGYFIEKLLHYDQLAKVCIPVPLYHCFGLVLGSIAAVSSGACQIFPARGFDAESALKAIHHERCTAIYGTPAMFIDMLNHPHFAKYDYTTLETGIMAGSPCPIEVMIQIIEKMHCKEMTIAYGLTETSPATNMTRRDTPVELRVSTVGQLLPHLEGKVIDKEGKILPINEPGEVCYRGHCVMQGYWEDETKTREAIDANGWFHTGDLAEVDEDGYIKIVGRIKDMVIRGGENIYPTEIENFLYKHPKIEDVQVFGIPDKKMGEELCAWIRLRRNTECTSDEIKSFCKGKISHYKIPRYIEFVDEYPMTVTGKIKKYVMREEMAKMMNK